MPIYAFRSIKGSARHAHFQVLINDQDAGEVWREQTHVVVSKISEPRRLERKWRWFAKRAGEGEILGRGTRAAALLGGGFPSKIKAAEQLHLRNEQA